jgi:hypothetical protein
MPINSSSATAVCSTLSTSRSKVFSGVVPSSETDKQLWQALVEEYCRGFP